MAKVLITGSSGAGKSEMAKLLAQRGYTAIDIDAEKMARLEDRTTGKPVQWPKGYVDWSKYAYNIDGSRLKDSLQGNDDIFVAVVGSNQKDFFHLFDTVIVLTISDPVEHLRRLRTRRVHAYGQDEKNLLRTVERMQSQADEWVSLGATAIDTCRSKEEVLNDIIRISRVRPRMV